jgi:hypothetical protein
MNETKTKTREQPFPQPDEEPTGDLPKPPRLTPQEVAEAQEREEQYRREWVAINNALSENAMAVFRAMRMSRRGSERKQIERVMTSYESGSFLINRLGAECVLDQDLVMAAHQGR